MSLRTDIAFNEALKSNQALIERLPAGGIFNPAINEPPENIDNEPLPYIILGFMGTQNDDTFKDNDYEGQTDNDQITITIAADSRASLGEIAEEVRRTIREFFIEHEYDDSKEEYQFIPHSHSFSAGPVNYDSMKPCCWQQLNYNCVTNI